MTKRSVSVILLLTALPLLTGGCGKGDGLERLEVSGTVTVNGTPLEQGRIAFLPAEGTPGPATGGEIENGRFKISRDQGPLAGTHRVEVIAVRSTGRQVAEGSGSETPDALVDEVEQYIPEQYNSSSTLTADLTPESAGTLAFDLEIPE